MCPASAGQAELRGAPRPGAVPAGVVPDPGRDPDLLLAAGLVRPAGATVGLPRADVELEAAVVAVARVRVPVAARLAAGEAIPGGAVRHGRRRRRRRRGLDRR